MHAYIYLNIDDYIHQSPKFTPRQCFILYGMSLDAVIIIKSNIATIYIYTYLHCKQLLRRTLSRYPITSVACKILGSNPQSEIVSCIIWLSMDLHLSNSMIFCLIVHVPLNYWPDSTFSTDQGFSTDHNVIYFNF